MLMVLLLRPIAVSMGLIDVPNGRSSHSSSTPLVGGLAIYLGVSIAYWIPALFGLVPINREIVSFFFAGFVLVGVGVIDDFIELSAPVRFIAQIFASFLMVYGAGVVLSDLGAITPGGQVLRLGWMAVPFTVFTTLGVINALNMCDGLDGLSGTLALISLTGLLLAAIFNGASGDVFILAALATGILGFLLFNFRILGRERASIFMGDSGSMFVGFALTWFAISLSQGEGRVITPAAALWFLMLPIFDTVTMIFRRAVRKRSPFSADREHIHHVFLMAGFNVNETIAIMAAAALIGVGVGLLSMDIGASEFSVAGLFLVVGLLYFWMVLRSWKVMRFIERSICRRRRQADRRSNIDRRRAVNHSYDGEDRRSGVNRRQQLRRQSDGTIAAQSSDREYDDISSSQQTES